MAIPAALAARRQQIEQEHGTIGADGKPVAPEGTPTAPEAPAAPQPTAPPAPAPAALDENMFAVPQAPTAPQAQPTLQAVDDDYKHKFLTLQGINRSQAAELAGFRDVVATLTEQVGQLRTAAPQSTPAPATPQAPARGSLALALPTVSLSEQEQATYGAAMPVIRAVAAQLMHEAMEPVLAHIQQLETQLSRQIGTAQTTVANVAKTSFRSTLSGRVPDLDTLLHSQEFQAFMDGRVQYSTETIRTRLKSAFDAHDVETIAAVVQDYRSLKGPTPPPPTPGQFTQPRTGGGAVPQPQQPDTGSKTMLAWSKRKEAGVQHMKRQMSTADFQAIEQLYKVAAAEGRVDYHA